MASSGLVKMERLLPTHISMRMVGHSIMAMHGFVVPQVKGKLMTTKMLMVVNITSSTRKGYCCLIHGLMT